MRKNWKRLLAMVMALSIMVSTMNLPAWAADEEPLCGQEAHVHGDGCYELTCNREHEDTYTIVEDTKVYDEHIHGAGCYADVPSCDKEEHIHTEACYVPAEVQDFLDAVAGIEVPEEDLVLEENAELAEEFSEILFAAYGLFEELTEEEQELEEVQIAMMELENMLTVLPDYGVSNYALSNVVVRPDYNPGSCVPGVSKFGGSISKAVGETGFYQRRAVQDFRCTGCGWYYGRSDAKEYANFEVVGENLDVITDISYEVGNLQGYPCLQMNFTGAKAGTAKVTLRYDVNFHTRWNSSYAACPSCGAMTPVLQYDDNWYHYEDTFYVTVESPKHEDQVWYVYVPTNGIENGSATIELNAVLPRNSIYYYNYGYVYNKYNAFMPVRNASLSDPNGVRGNYANVTWEYTRHKDWVGAPSYDYGINLTVTGLDTPTPDGKPISVFLNYEWPYSCQLVNANDFYMYYNMRWGNTVKSEIRIVVYEPETVTIKAGDANKYTHNYGDEQTGKSVDRLSYGAKLWTVNDVKNSPNIPKSSNENVVKPSFWPDTDLLYRSGTSAWYWAVGKEEGTAKVSTTYTYFGNYVGSASNYIEVYPRTTYVDVVNYKVIADDVNTTPVTIVKEFDGLTEDQIPDNFQLKYTIAGCSEHKTTQAVMLNKADATVTNANGTPSLVWNVDLPAVKHGDVTHTITFTESNAGVTGFTGPIMTGSTVTLESLTVEDGVKPVITVTNKYDPDKNMYVLSYDGMGGIGCPATQYTNIGNTTNHTFEVKGAETELKVPTHPQGYTFLGWSETDTNQAVAYAYNSEIKTYTPATITLTKAAPSKTLYAVWKERPHVEPNPKLEKLEKVRVTNGAQAPAGTPSDVEYGTVIFRSDDQKVKLLYKITVTGTEGAQYKVTDEGAEWVSGGTATKDGTTLVVTGTIADGETTAVIYVTKEFGAADIKNNMLTNNAELVSNGTTDDPTDGPSGDNGKDGDNSDASEQRNVTINFKTDGGETLKDSYDKDYDKGGNFEGINVNKPANARKAAPRATAETIVIPWTIEKDGKTYVLDEVASKGALDRLGALQTVTQDVVEDIIYSLDMKGGNDTTKPDGGSDGIPDKYQAKVVYTATTGGSQDGVDTYATIMKDGKMATEGTISIAGATATANSGYYFVSWTAGATGHDGWNHGPSTDAELAGFSIDDAKGGAVYTFTANFAAKTALAIKIVGNTNTVTYNGNEQSVTGYTMTVKDKDGNEIDLPAGLTVTPASADSVAKGTAASETAYPMGLTQDGFGVTGDNAGKYTVTFTVTDGWLKINPPETVLDVTAGPVETTYDGQEHPVTPVVTVDGVTVNDATVTIVYKDAEGNVITGVPTDAGTYTAEITATKDGKSDSTTATVKINPKALTVTTDSASKTYDGTALTAPGRVDGLVDGETVTFTVTGTQTAVGNSRNGYTLTWDGSAKESNYTVAEGTIGTLTVNAVNNNDDDDDDDGPDPVRPTEPEPSPEPTVPEPVEPGPVVEPEPAPGPEVEDIADLPDDDVPLADLPKDPEEFEELEEPDVPLANVPETGDAMLAWASAAALSGLGLAFLSRRKKEENI